MGQHGCELQTGEVTGFVRTGNAIPTVYASGDNAAVEHVRAVADRFGPVDGALLFAGAAKTQLLAPWCRCTSAAGRCPPKGAISLRGAFADAGIANQLRLLQLGERITL